MHIQIGGDKNFRRRFEGGRPHHPLELAVEVATTSALVHDPTVEIAMAQSTFQWNHGIVCRAGGDQMFHHLFVRTLNSTCCDPTVVRLIQLC